MTTSEPNFWVIVSSVARWETAKAPKRPAEHWTLASQGNVHLIPESDSLLIRNAIETAPLARDDGPTADRIAFALRNRDSFHRRVDPAWSTVELTAKEASLTPYPQRKRTRAPGFDYRDPGPYFVTICVNERRTLLGRVADGEMRRSAAGEMVHHAWIELANKYPLSRWDAFVVMPNHVHGLVTLAIPPVENLRQPHPLDGYPSLSDMVGWFKTMTTNWYLRGVKEKGWPRYSAHLWQPSFHDHIVRDDADMDRLRTYIAGNPANWHRDTFYEP